MHREKFIKNIEWQDKKSMDKTHPVYLYWAQILGIKSYRFAIEIVCWVQIEGVSIENIEWFKILIVYPFLI